MDTLNDLRGMLASTLVPMSIGELEELSKLPRPQVRAALDQLIDRHLAEREGHGPGARYKLATGGEARAEAGSGPPRVVRRPPRAKNWLPTSEQAPAEAAPEGGETTT